MNPFDVLQQAFTDLQAKARALQAADTNKQHATDDVAATTALLAKQQQVLDQAGLDDVAAATDFNAQIETVKTALDAAKVTR